MQYMNELENYVNRREVDKAREMFGQLFIELKKKVKQKRRKPFKKMGEVNVLDNTSIRAILSNFYEKYYKLINRLRENEEVEKEIKEFEEFFVREVVKDGIETTLYFLERVEEKLKDRVIEEFSKKQKVEYDKFYYYPLMLRIYMDMYESFKHEKLKELVEMVIEKGIEYLKSKENREKIEVDSIFRGKLKLHDYNREIENFVERASLFYKGDESKIRALNELRREFEIEEANLKINRTTKNSNEQKRLSNI